MRDYQIRLCQGTLGVTQPALKALRDELALRIRHNIALVEVPAAPDNCQCYGIFLVDETFGEVVIIGDGFRGDGGGEGGAGHRAAQALMTLYGLRPLTMLPEGAICYSEDESLYRDIVDKVVAAASPDEFKMPLNERPQYVDWCFRGK